MPRVMLIRLLLMTCAAVPVMTGEAPGPGARMDYGEVVAYGIGVPGGASEAVHKGLAIRLSADAAVCFDTDTLRYACSWRGGFIDMSVTNAARTAQGKAVAPIVGKPVFAIHHGPGWADAAGDFSDPRPGQRGELPAKWGHYRGLQRHGEQVVLSYTVGDVVVRETPGLIAVGDGVAFTRTIEIAAGPACRLVVAEVPGAASQITVAHGSDGNALAAPGTVAMLEPLPAGSTDVTAVGLRTAAASNGTIALHGPMLEAKGDRILVRLLERTQPERFIVTVWSGAPAALAQFSQALTSAVPADLAALSQPAPARWPALNGSGVRAKDAGAYVVDTITVPTGIPGNSWIRPSGIAFLADGSAVLCTFGGEVWKVSGLTSDLASVRWKRFASGLYEPLGVVVVDGEVYVTGRDRITRLRDLNGDGEADVYDNFHSLGTSWDDYHDFVFDLAVGVDGAFYLARGGNRVPWDLADHSALLRIAKDGSSRSVIATGFRAPNGLGIGPQGQITVGDNQGHWTPSSKINLVKPGGSYGYVADPRLPVNEAAKKPARFDPPLCWIPMSADNSSASQVWATGDRWGPLSGNLLHLSYGRSALLVVSQGEVDGIAQGGVVSLPLRFASGIMRGRFNPADGQLYVCGLKGWQTNAGQDGCFQRVRWTGKDIQVPVRMQVRKDAIELVFSGALNPASVIADNVAAQRWNYQWTSTYGSPDVKPDGTPGRESVEVGDVKLAADGKTVTFTIPHLAPVMQFGLKYRFEAKDGAEVTQEFFGTINAVPK